MDARHWPSLKHCSTRRWAGRAGRGGRWWRSWTCSGPAWSWVAQCTGSCRCSRAALGRGRGSRGWWCRTLLARGRRMGKGRGGKSSRHQPSCQRALERMQWDWWQGGANAFCFLIHGPGDWIDWWATSQTNSEGLSHEYILLVVMDRKFFCSHPDSWEDLWMRFAWIHIASIPCWVFYCLCHFYYYYHWLWDIGQEYRRKRENSKNSAFLLIFIL